MVCVVPAGHSNSANADYSYFSISEFMQETGLVRSLVFYSLASDHSLYAPYSGPGSVQGGDAQLINYRG